MSVTTYLRHPGSLLAAISATIGLVWYALGQPVAMPHSPLAANEKLDCISYWPYRPGQSPTYKTLSIPLEQIEDDLARISTIASCVRTYSAGKDLARVPEIAGKHRLTVLQGIALGRDAEQNRAEIAAAIAIARTHRNAIRALVVGNEVLSRGDMSIADLRNIIRRIREQTRLPISYADGWESWLNSGELAAAVDFLTVHVRPYQEEFPLKASSAVQRLQEIRSKITAAFPNKDILIGEFGWPSAGRMRESALPSPSNQARVLHEAVAAAKAGGFRINILEAFDQTWKQPLQGSAGMHWGLYDAELRSLKFRWGSAVSDHPQWFFQGLIGILFAFVIFAAGFFAARSRGPVGISRIDWTPVAGMALAGGLFMGQTLANVPIELNNITHLFTLIFMLALSVATPPLAAAASIRGAPFEGFTVLFDPLSRRASEALSRMVTLLFVLTVIASIQSGLALVFEPYQHDFPFAPLTGPAAALLILALNNPRGIRRENASEASAAFILFGAALFISLNETFLNWQAQWFAIVLVALGWSCLRARGARNP